MVHYGTDLCEFLLIYHIPLQNFWHQLMKDALYQKAVDIVKTERKASTSFLQRKLQIGYNRAARIMETMEKEGIVGQANHVGKREIL